MATLQKIFELVENEFGDKAKHFAAREFSMNALEGAEYERTKTGGVYVFVHEKFGVVKVGKSQSNASKRAREHVRDNTQTKSGVKPQIQMHDFLSDPNCKLVVLNVDDSRNMHWVLALEHFLEHKLNPCIRSVRNG